MKRKALALFFGVFVARDIPFSETTTLDCCLNHVAGLIPSPLNRRGCCIAWAGIGRIDRGGFMLQPIRFQAQTDLRV
jgi:hypothetical protein